jgi:phosphoglycolate phosphatase-like HAD superfamily hydrolase
MKAVELLILDNNGTMFDDFHLAYGSVEAIFRVFGKRCPPREVYRQEITSNFMQFYWRHGIPEWATGDQLNVIRRLYYRHNLATATYRKDLLPALEVIRSLKVRLAVCSAEIEQTLDDCLCQAKLKEFFVLPCAEKKDKPSYAIKAQCWPDKQEGIKSLVQSFGIEPSAAWLVDDSAEALHDARKIGVRTIAFAHSSSYNRREKLATASPDHTVNDFAELARLVTRLNR